VIELTNERALGVGVADDQSIAWGVAGPFLEAGLSG